MSWSESVGRGYLMTTSKRYGLYIDGAMVRRVSGIGQAHEILLQLGESMRPGECRKYEVRLGGSVLWEGELEASSGPEEVN